MIRFNVHKKENIMKNIFLGLLMTVGLTTSLAQAADYSKEESVKMVDTGINEAGRAAGCTILAHTNYLSSIGGSACVRCGRTLVNVTWTTSSSGNIYESEIVSSIHLCGPGGH